MDERRIFLARAGGTGRAAQVSVGSLESAVVVLLRDEEYAEALATELAEMRERLGVISDALLGLASLDESGNSDSRARESFMRLLFDHRSRPE